SSPPPRTARDVCAFLWTAVLLGCGPPSPGYGVAGLQTGRVARPFAAANGRGPTNTARLRLSFAATNSIRSGLEQDREDVRAGHRECEAVLHLSGLDGHTVERLGIEGPSVKIAYAGQGE